MAQASRKIKNRGQTIGLVPTMGALHEGHLALVNAAKKKADVVIVSIFVNPLQFGPTEDIKKYPRTLREDKKRLKDFDPIIIFAPKEKDLTPQDISTTIDVEDLSKRLCGKSRPGHFRGVAVMVSKLFNIVQPDFAFLGEKDYQQQLIVKKLARDLNYNIIIETIPTVREYDGLAFSSRNKHLSDRERKAASILYKSLVRASEAIQSGEKDGRRIHYLISQHIGREPIAKIDYVGVCNPETLEEIKNIKGKALLAAAVHIGHTRLIDNMVVHA